MKNRSFLLSIMLVCCAAIFAIDPSVTLTDYYADANGKSGQQLRLALRGAIDHHTNISYGYLGYIMKYADTKNADGVHLIDIYSDAPYSTTTTNKNGNHDISDDRVNWIAGGEVGEGLNREHTVPQSWFAKADPMVADMFHIYPTDAKCNNHRSSYLYGEIYPKNAGETLVNGSYKELGALGSTYVLDTDLPASKYTYQGVEYMLATYDGTVYEPADEFKGDLARGIFYMATRYASPDANDGTDCATWKNKSNPTHFGGDELAGDKFGLTEYSWKLLLKWHRQDPVSEKELLRNEVIYGNPTYNKSNYKQGNRNPFIDYPELVEYIWGNKAGQSVVLSSLTSPYSEQGGGGNPQTDPVIDAPDEVKIVAEPYDKGEKIFTVSFINFLEAPSISIIGADADKFSLYLYDDTWGWEQIQGNSVTFSRTVSSLDIKVEYGENDWNNKFVDATLKITAGTVTKTIALHGQSAFMHTVEWFVDGVQVQKEVVLNGEKIQNMPPAPDVPAGCSGKIFAGWCFEEIETPQDVRPSKLYTNVSELPAIYDKYAKVTRKLYAVFTKESTVSGGDPVSFGVSDFLGQGIQGGKTDGTSTVTATKNGTTVFCSNAYGTSYSLRAYKNSTVTISSDKAISEIDFTIEIYNKNGAEKLVPNAGDYSWSADSLTGTWTGSAKAVEFSCSYQVRIVSITVKFAPGTVFTDYSSRCGNFYQITFQYGDGIDDKMVFEVREGVVPNYPYSVYKPMTDKYEFEFDSWSPSLVPATQNATYTAVFDSIVRLYPVMFITDGAYVPEQSVPWGEHVAKPETPDFGCRTKHLEGWYKDASYTTLYNFATETINSSDLLVIYGRTVYEGTVVYIVEHNRTFGTEMINEYDTIDYVIPANQETEWVDIPIPSRTYIGYNCSSPLSEQISLCADTLHFTINYMPNQHTLNWDANGGVISDGEHDFTQTQTLPYGTHFAYPTTMTKDGDYVFVGWEPTFTVDEKGQPYMPDEDVTYKAIWQQRQYTVTVEPNNTSYGTTMVSGTTTFTLEELKGSAMELNLNATAAQGYEFAAWLDKGLLTLYTADELIAQIKSLYETTTSPQAKALLGALLTPNGTLTGEQIGLLWDEGIIFPDKTTGVITLQAIFKAKTPTGLEDTEDASQPRKLLMNGELIILHNGQKYNVMGAKL